ncbi:MAG TPA: glycoside hydrolase family 88 protein [Planosporangium sp.]|nr:glycoside hydrolase family 88 protein [Planosporangium sp.]
MPGNEPEWARFIDLAYLFGEAAHCFRDLGEATQIDRFGRDSAAEATRQRRARRGALSQAALAMGELTRNEAEAAATRGLEVINLTRSVSSSRCIATVRDLTDRFKPYEHLEQVQRFQSEAERLLGVTAWHPRSSREVAVGADGDRVPLDAGRLLGRGPLVAHRVLRAECRRQAGERLPTLFSGRWFQLVAKPGLSGNFTETSCSSTYTYTISRAVEKGYVDAGYRAVSAKGYQGVLARVSSTGDVREICVGTNVGNQAYYLARPRKTNDLHGLGAFLIMNEQLAKTGS